MKWLQWMSKVFMITVFATIVSLVTAWVMVDLYAEQILKKFNLNDLRTNVQLFDVVGHLSNQTSPEHSGQDLEQPDRETAPHSTTQDSEPLEETEDGAEGSVREDDAVAVWGQAASKSEVVMSADEFNEARDKLSGEDKLKIFSILSNNLTEELMMQLSVMLEGGLTREELSEIEQMMKNLLNEEQFEQLMDIILPFITP